VEVGPLFGMPVPHSYSVGIRSPEELQPHLELLKEYAKATTAEHGEVKFELESVAEVISCYFATLPPVILRWVQRRAEVSYIEPNFIVELDD
jgi:hypothetical protein